MFLINSAAILTLVGTLLSLMALLLIEDVDVDDDSSAG